MLYFESTLNSYKKLYVECTPLMQQLSCLEQCIVTQLAHNLNSTLKLVEMPNLVELSIDSTLFHGWMLDVKVIWTLQY
jgi:hypothetical protein